MRHVHGVPVYVCTVCGLGFVHPHTPRKPTHEIYSFAEYAKRESQFEKRYLYVIHELGKLIDANERKSPMPLSVLEVGAGFGLLSKMLDEQGYNVTALEPYVQPQYAVGTGVKHISKTLAQFVNVNTEQFDCIILFDVLEHVDDLHSTVQHIQNMLKPDGVVIIQTPNYKSLMQYLSKDWSWWMIEDHRFFFDKQSFIRLFEANGMQLALYKAYEDLQDFRKNTDGWLSNIQSDAVRRAFKIPLYGLVFSLRFLFLPFYRYGIGGLHLGYFRKTASKDRIGEWEHKSV